MFEGDIAWDRIWINLLASSIMRFFSLILPAVLTTGVCLAQPFTNSIPIPPAKPQVISRSGPLNQRLNTPQGVQVISPQPTGAVNTNHPLKWDAMVKEYKAKPGDTTNLFTFAVVNSSTNEAYINFLRPSCGCTTAQLPSTPWKLDPGKGGDISVTMNFAGKQGVVAKTVTVETTHGPQVLLIKVEIPQDPHALTMANRSKNQQMALADRQAVFKGDCASCHVTPTIGKHSSALYETACGICHEAEHRATMVPDLKQLKNPTSPEYWRHWVTQGKVGSLMPAFSQAQGGPLSDAQVDSLVTYLSANFKPSLSLTNAAALPNSKITGSESVPQIPTN